MKIRLFYGLLPFLFLLGVLLRPFIFPSPFPSQSGLPFPSTVGDRDMERELIRMDIEEAGNRVGLSPRAQAEYLMFLDKASIKYDTPMLLLHAIVYTESSYNPLAPHPTIFVDGKRTNAIGFGGIVWEYNSKILIAESIAVARLDLADPRTNLLATACIVHHDIQDIFAKNPSLSSDRFFDELIRRYYGAYDKKYKDTMLAKIKDMASKQWIHRIVRTISMKYQSDRQVVTKDDATGQSGMGGDTIQHRGKLSSVKLAEKPKG